MALKGSAVVADCHAQVELTEAEHARKKARFDEKNPALKATRDEARRLKL